MGFTEKKEIDINNFNKEILTTSAWLQFTQGDMALILIHAHPKIKIAMQRPLPAMPKKQLMQQ
jgi:hypothetical protein